jgi:HEAT repeat protein
LPDQAKIHKECISEWSKDRRGAIRLLEAYFSNLPDKNQAWQDLYRLTQDENIYVRGEASRALESVFSQVPDKNQAWQDLHRLTQDEECEVRGEASRALESVFNQVPDKNQAWQDLYRLTQDEDRYVRMFAYHSLGRASVFKATEKADKNALKKKLEAAVAYFKNSSYERGSPAKFCYPFYRSYLAITFQGAKEDEVQRYLAEAKEAVGSSKSKDELLKAVENLALALQENSHGSKFREREDGR